MPSRQAGIGAASGHPLAFLSGKLLVQQPRAVCNSADTPLSLASQAMFVVTARAVPVPLGEGWGEGSKELKNWNFSSSIISPIPSPALPPSPFKMRPHFEWEPARCGLRPEGREKFGVAIQICVDNRDFERAPRAVYNSADKPRALASGKPGRGVNNPHGDRSQNTSQTAPEPYGKQRQTSPCRRKAPIIILTVSS